METRDRTSFRPSPTTSFHDECGVFGVFGRQDAAAIVALGLHALQHRGQEAAGIVSYDGTQFHVERHVGLVGDTFTKPARHRAPARQPRHRPHRYATTGGAGLRNVQPLFAELADGGFAIAHNGNLTNAMTAAARAAEAAARSSVDLRHRDDPPSDRHQPARRDRRLALHRRAAPGRGRLLAGRR